MRSKGIWWDLNKINGIFFNYISLWYQLKAWNLIISKDRAQKQKETDSIPSSHHSCPPLFWSSINLILHQSDPPSVWSSINLALHQFDPPSYGEICSLFDHFSWPSPNESMLLLYVTDGLPISQMSIWHHHVTSWHHYDVIMWRHDVTMMSSCDVMTGWEW